MDFTFTWYMSSGWMAEIPLLCTRRALTVAVPRVCVNYRDVYLANILLRCRMWWQQGCSHGCLRTSPVLLHKMAALSVRLQDLSGGLATSDYVAYSNSTRTNYKQTDEVKYKQMIQRMGGKKE